MGPRGRQRFVWRGLNQKQLDGEKVEDPGALTTPEETATPGWRPVQRVASAQPLPRALGRPGHFGIPLPALGWGRRRAWAL